MGNRIDMKTLRLANGYSQRKLAAAAGVGDGAVAKWDKGAQPDARMLPVLARLFKCNRIDDLYTDINYVSRG